MYSRYVGSPFPFRLIPTPSVALSTLPNLRLLSKSKMAALAFARPKNKPALQAMFSLKYEVSPFGIFFQVVTRFPSVKLRRDRCIEQLKPISGSQHENMRTLALRPVKCK